MAFPLARQRAASPLGKALLFVFVVAAAAARLSPASALCSLRRSPRVCRLFSCLNYHLAAVGVTSPAALGTPGVSFAFTAPPPPRARRRRLRDRDDLHEGEGRRRGGLHHHPDVLRPRRVRFVRRGLPKQVCVFSVFASLCFALLCFVTASGVVCMLCHLRYGKMRDFMCLRPVKTVVKVSRTWTFERISGVYVYMSTSRTDGLAVEEVVHVDVAKVGVSLTPDGFLNGSLHGSSFSGASFLSTVGGSRTTYPRKQSLRGELRL